MQITPACPLPADEPQRLAVLDSYDVLDAPLGSEFTDLVRLAQRVFDAPIALLSIMGADRQILKVGLGVAVRELRRVDSLCSHTILGREVLVVPDARADARFAASPLVTGAPRVRFYAGAPLVTPDGASIGSLCVIDTEPRSAPFARERAMLENLARLVMERLEARRLARRDTDSRKRFESIAALSPEAIICADGANRILSWNTAAEVIFGHTAQEAIGQSLSMIVPAALRPRHEAGLARIVAGQASRIAGSLVTVPALRRDGTEIPIELSLTHWTEGGEHRFGAIARDITDRRLLEERLKREAETDHLTGLANRKRLTEAMEAASAAGRPAALLLLDLDGFKEVNDSLGHAVGDEVLRAVAGRLCVGVAGDGLVARLGGDEFAILLDARTDGPPAAALGAQLIAAIERPIEIEERCIYVGASGGVALADKAGWRPDDLLGDADLALYRAKADGRRRVCLFTPSLRSVARTRSSVSSGLRGAWERREFEMHYQPQVRLADRSLTGAEALIRWNHPEQGLVGPAGFLSVLESSLLALPVAKWILRTACAQASRCRSLGLADFRVGVNLFAAQFRSGDLPQVVEDALTDFGLPADALELEITENIILRSDSRIMTDLADLRAIGVGIAFDDYGTGYASLTMLKDYTVTRLKIDRSFVSGVDRNRKDQTIVEAISMLAKGFDLEVIAEGIETESQAVLMGRHCGEGQGYLFGRPMPGPLLEAACLPAKPGVTRTLPGLVRPKTVGNPARQAAG